MAGRWGGFGFGAPRPNDHFPMIMVRRRRPDDLAGQLVTSCARQIARFMGVCAHRRREKCGRRLTVRQLGGLQTWHRIPHRPYFHDHGDVSGAAIENSPRSWKRRAQGPFRTCPTLPGGKVARAGRSRSYFPVWHCMPHRRSSHDPEALSAMVRGPQRVSEAWTNVGGAAGDRNGGIHDGERGSALRDRRA